MEFRDWTTTLTVFLGTAHSATSSLDPRTTLPRDSIIRWCPSTTSCSHVLPLSRSHVRISWSGPIDDLDRLLRGRGLVPLWRHKASSHYQWRTHASAFLDHWTIGALSLQSGEIAEWLPIVSPLGDARPRSAVVGLQPRQPSHLDHCCPPWQRSAARTLGPLPLHKNVITPAAWMVADAVAVHIEESWIRATEKLVTSNTIRNIHPAPSGHSDWRGFASCTNPTPTKPLINFHSQTITQVPEQWWADSSLHV